MSLSILGWLNPFRYIRELWTSFINVNSQPNKTQRALKTSRIRQKQGVKDCAWQESAMQPKPKVTYLQVTFTGGNLITGQTGRGDRGERQVRGAVPAQSQEDQALVR